MPTYLSEHVYIGNGDQTDFTFNKGYLSRSHVIVKVSTDGGSTYVTKTDPTDYEWIDSQTIRFDTAPAADAVIWLDRVTPRTIDITYANGTVFTDVNQNYDYRQPMYILQEQFDELDRRPALGVDQEDVEETLAQVMGNLTLDGTNLVASTFNLAAAVGRDSSGRLVISLTKVGEADTEIAIPGAVEVPAGIPDGEGGSYLTDWLRIANYTPSFFGNIHYDNGSGCAPAEPLAAFTDQIEWDGTLRYSNGSNRYAGWSFDDASAPNRQLKIRCADGQYTDLYNSTGVYWDGLGYWEFRIRVNVRTASVGYRDIIYRRAGTFRDTTPWGEYTLTPSGSGGTGGTSADLENCTPTFPGTLTLERF